MQYVDIALTLNDRRGVVGELHHRYYPDVGPGIGQLLFRHRLIYIDMVVALR